MKHSTPFLIFVALLTISVVSNIWCHYMIHVTRQHIASQAITIDSLTVINEAIQAKPVRLNLAKHKANKLVVKRDTGDVSLARFIKWQEANIELSRDSSIYYQDDSSDFKVSQYAIATVTIEHSRYENGECNLTSAYIDKIRECVRTINGLAYNYNNLIDRVSKYEQLVYVKDGIYMSKDVPMYIDTEGCYTRFKPNLKPVFEQHTLVW